MAKVLPRLYIIVYTLYGTKVYSWINSRKVLSLWDSASIKQPLSQCPLEVKSIARPGNTHVEGTQENRLDEPVLLSTESNV